jgi:hypothetical protein
VAADAATAVWTILWVWIAWQLYTTLASFAAAARLVHDGGVNLRSAGTDIGASMVNLPVVGEQLGTVVRGSITNAANPFVDFGTELETLVLVLAAVISLLLLAVPLVPWFSRYLPWRVSRLRQLRAANRVVRSSRVPSTVAEELLAARALYRLDYQTLLDYTPDPFGDFTSGRHDRLARAELATVGLRLRR